MSVTEQGATTEATRSRGPSTVTSVWFLFCLVALLALDWVPLAWWAAGVLLAAAALFAVPPLRPRGAPRRVDVADLVTVAGLYVLVVASFRVAFTVFTTESVLGLFLCFAAGMLVGVVGPLLYQVWGRGRPLRSLGLGRHQLRATLVMGLVLAAAQFVVTLAGYSLPAPAAWVPLLGMSLVVGFFEAVFFRGFVQGRLEASFGPAPAVAAAAVLYAAYHVGYGMDLSEMWFLLALGVVYAAAYRLTGNVLVVWPLLTPLGAFFTNLRAGDIDLPWASLLGFADVAAVMAAAVWFAHRHEQRVSRQATAGRGADVPAGAR